eukprot:Sdes_comp17914_c0_seq2m7172
MMIDEKLLESYLDFVKSIGISAGKIVFNVVKNQEINSNQISLKSSSADLVTETDEQVEKKLIDSLRKKYPDHKFIGEESAAAGNQQKLTDSPTWIIDPIDGTTNFIHGYPNVCICIGLSIKKE